VPVLNLFFARRPIADRLTYLVVPEKGLIVLNSIK